MDAGVESLKDESLARRLREKAAAIHKRSLLVAAAITVVVLLFPTSIPH